MQVLSWVVLGTALVTCAAAMLNDGMLAYAGRDGTLEYYRDSTGSNSDMDINLLAAFLLLPSGLLRAARARHRPWLAEFRSPRPRSGWSSRPSPGPRSA